MTNFVELIGEGATLMIVGMVIVYLVLGLLVVLINAMAAAVRRYLPPPVVVTRQPLPPAASGATATELAAISAAIHQHRSRHPKS